MTRVFNITIPTDSNYHNLYSLIVGTAVYGLVNGGTNETGITGAIPTDGILPDRVSGIEIQADGANSGTVTIGDRNNANTSGKVLNSGDSYLRSNINNCYCVKDYFLKGSAQVVEVSLEA